MFILLVCVALDSAWDYVEARRVRDAVRTLQASGAPTAENQINAAFRDSDSGASSLYASAGHLVLRSAPASAAIGKQLSAALASGDVDGDLRARLAQYLGTQKEAFALLDLATPLPFSRFSARDWYPGLPTALQNLYDLSALRTLLAILGHESDEAARALVSEMVLVGPSGPNDGTRVISAMPTVDRLALAIQDFSLSQLSTIESALGRAVDDHRLERQLTAQRARAIDTFLSTAAYRRGFAWRFFQRPLAAHLFLNDLETYASKLAGTRTPWPGPIASAEVGQPDLTHRLDGWPHTAVGLPPTAIEQAASEIAAFRSAVAAVAVQRYRLTHDGMLPSALDQIGPDLPVVPVDPFSGSPLTFKATASDFVIYSVGPDRRDNGGDLRRGNLVGDPLIGSNAHRGSDIGIRVALRPPDGNGGR